MLTADFAGAYNSNIIRAVSNAITERHKSKEEVVILQLVELALSFLKNVDII